MHHLCLSLRLKLGHIGSLVCGNLLLALLIRESLGVPPLLGSCLLGSSLLGGWIVANGLVSFLVDILDLQLNNLYKLAKSTTDYLNIYDICTTINRKFHPCRGGTSNTGHWDLLWSTFGTASVVGNKTQR